MKGIVIFCIFALAITSNCIFSDRIKGLLPKGKQDSELDSFLSKFKPSYNFDVLNNVSISVSPLSQSATGNVQFGHIYLKPFTTELVLVANSNLKPGPWHRHCAFARYADKINDDGWDRLHIKSFAKCDPLIQMYAAGYLESYLAWQKVSDFNENYVAQLNDTAAYDAMNQFYADSVPDLTHKTSSAYLRSLHNSTEFIFWFQIALANAQTNGILAGFNAMSPSKMTLSELWQMNNAGSVTMQEMFQYLVGEKKPLYASADILERQSHCSVLIKPVYDENNLVKDVVMSHATWSSYSTMLRTFKNYEFEQFGGRFHNSMFSYYQNTFSGVPGGLISGDDWYLIDNHFMVTETTLLIIDNSIYPKIYAQLPSTPDFMRIMAANRLATSGASWANWMGFLSTGTYYSAWMIVDLHKAKESIGQEKLVQGTLYQMEQMYDVIANIDLSDYLNENGYWQSSNNAYNSKVRDISGYTEATKNDSTLAWNHNPRGTKYANKTNKNIIKGVIFKAMQHTVQDLPTLKHMMRQNEWTKSGPYDPADPTDPIFSSPCHAIACRGDLVPNTPSNFGEIDAKVATLEMALQNQCHAVSGPTHDEQPVFIWSQSPVQNLHKGIPDNMGFDFVVMDPETIENA